MEKFDCKYWLRANINTNGYCFFVFRQVFVKAICSRAVEFVKEKNVALIKSSIHNLELIADLVGCYFRHNV